MCFERSSIYAWIQHIKFLFLISQHINYVRVFFFEACFDFLFLIQACFDLICHFARILWFDLNRQVTWSTNSVYDSWCKTRIDTCFNIISNNRCILLALFHPMHCVCMYSLRNHINLCVVLSLCILVDNFLFESSFDFESIRDNMVMINFSCPNIGYADSKLNLRFRPGSTRAWWNLQQIR